MLKVKTILNKKENKIMINILKYKVEEYNKKIQAKELEIQAKESEIEDLEDEKETLETERDVLSKVINEILDEIQPVKTL